jgi:hypothetical protein
MTIRKQSSEICFVLSFTFASAHHVLLCISLSGAHCTLVRVAYMSPTTGQTSPLTLQANSATSTPSAAHFRRVYYSTLGFQSQEVKASTLFHQDPLDVDTLKQLCFHYKVPDVYRALIWKVVLGVLPARKDAWTYVESQRKACFDELQRGAHVLFGTPLFAALKR